MTRLLGGKSKRGPRTSTMEVFYERARSLIGKKFDIIARDDLLELRQQLFSEPGIPWAADGPRAALPCPHCGTSFLVEPAELADYGVELAARWLDGRAPVPYAQGDRRTSGDVVTDVALLSRSVLSGGLLWPPAADLAYYLDSGQLENSNSVIHHVATEAPPIVAANAVITCRDLDLPDAVDSIIAYAGRRNDRDVLQILRPLLQHERHIDAGALLDRALGAVVERHPTSSAR